MRAAAAIAVRALRGALANGYSSSLASINRSTPSKGSAKTHNVANAAAYSVRHVKSKSPRSICRAEPSDVDRKNSNVRQKILKVTIRCAHTEKKLSEEVAPPSLSFGGKTVCSTKRATP